jgi:hypothetical protein
LALQLRIDRQWFSDALASEFAKLGEFSIAAAVKQNVGAIGQT